MFALEVVQEGGELLALELVCDGASNEAGEPAWPNATAYGASEVTGDADGELGCGLSHEQVLP
ncbi:MAG: hypothetical protein IPF92_15765 [Myxococcales bacterium]|nr:hypothetical protein [Myxococcales bacterium]MBL0197563.1 hypothetical protein [Myxococcales bacterium]HQY60401.1 hypothetical protein [Polyangiaceae bacterium]